MLIYIEIESCEYDTITVFSMGRAVDVLEEMAEEGIDAANDVQVTEVFEDTNFTYTGMEYLCLE